MKLNFGHISPLFCTECAALLRSYPLHLRWAEVKLWPVAIPNHMTFSFNWFTCYITQPLFNAWGHRLLPSVFKLTFSWSKSSRADQRCEDPSTVLPVEMRFCCLTSHGARMVNFVSTCTVHAFSSDTSFAVSFLLFSFSCQDFSGFPVVFLDWSLQDVTQHYRI